MSLFYNPYSKHSFLPPQSDIMNILMMLRLFQMFNQPQGQTSLGITPPSPARMTEMWNLPFSQPQQTPFGF